MCFRNFLTLDVRRNIESDENRFEQNMFPFHKINISPIRSFIRLALFALLVGPSCSTNNDGSINSTGIPTIEFPRSISADSRSNCDLGFCFAILENRTNLKNWRIVSVSLNEDDFSLNNINIIVKHLSEMYAEPKLMMVDIATDPAFFTQASHGKTYYKQMAHYVRRDGYQKIAYTASIPTQELTNVDLSDR